METAQINEREANKVMQLTKWFVDKYFKTYELMSSAPKCKA